MFEKYMIYDDGFRNVEKNGEIVGFQVGVRITYYRGVCLAVIGNFEVTVDGEKYTKDQMTFTCHEGTYTFNEMIGRKDLRWDFGEVAYLTIDKKGGLEQGKHLVKVLEEIRVVYGLMDKMPRNIAQWEKEIELRETYILPQGIKRGVSLYSYQQKYYLGEMSLEDCIKEVTNQGADGIEIISEAMIPNFPNPPQTWVNKWYELLEKYDAKAICYDAFMDGQIYKGEFITDDQAVEIMKRDIELASKLGFKYIRVLVAVPLRIIKRALPYAEKKNIMLGIEVHAPFKLATPWLDEYIDFINESGTKYFGIIPDLGIFVEKPVRILEKKHIRNGATPKIVKFISDSYSQRKKYEDIIDNVRKMNPTEEDLKWAEEAFHYTYCDPELLKEYIPYIVHVHGKMYEMNNGEEVSIPTDKVVKVLKENGWKGYISTEYEGQRHYHDIPDWDVNSVKQVREHQKMLKKYIES